MRNLTDNLPGRGDIWGDPPDDPPFEIPDWFRDLENHWDDLLTNARRVPEPSARHAAYSHAATVIEGAGDVLCRVPEMEEELCTAWVEHRERAFDLVERAAKEARE